MCIIFNKGNKKYLGRYNKNLSQIILNRFQIKSKALLKI